MNFYDDSKHPSFDQQTNHLEEEEEDEDTQQSKQQIDTGKLNNSGSKLNLLIENLVSAKKPKQTDNGSTLSAAETLLEIKNYFRNMAENELQMNQEENAEIDAGKPNEDNSLDEEQKVLDQLQSDNGNLIF
jgi:hypothetical protein